jgi:flagellar protein FliL
MAKDDDKEVQDGEEKKKGGKLKLIIMVVPVILLIAGAAWFFLLKPKSDSGPVTLPEPTPGAVVTLDPITINLAGAHFLKLGMALQPTSTAKEAPDGSKALDLTIRQFSGMSIDELANGEGREHAKEDLINRVKLAYLPHGTDLATAFAGTTEEAAASSENKKTAENEKKSEVKVDTKDLTEHALDGLSDDQAAYLVSKLSIQPDVYDVYFTEFVMQ